MEVKVPEKMDPALRAMKAIHTVASAGTSVSPEDLEKQRAGQDLFSTLVPTNVGVSTEKFVINEMKCEKYIPSYCYDHKHAILYCHGGGYTCGSIKYASVLGSKLAFHTAMTTFSFEYGLAPENPYPKALEDALEAWDYVMKLGYGARDVLVAGDSAGGNLALELCLTLREQGRMLPKALILMSPWTDMTTESETYETCKKIDPMITKDYVQAVRGAYVGENVDYSDPRFSPLFADFTDFPPTYIQVGTNEVLLGDSKHLAERLKEANIPVKLDVYKRGWHVFQQMPVRKAITAMNDVGQFTQKLLMR